MIRGSVGRSLGLLEELGLGLHQVQTLALREERARGLHQVKTLDALHAIDAEPTVKELGDRLGLSLPGISRNVDGLLRARYVERREDEHDRRMKRLRLTPAGLDAIERLNAARLEGLEAFTASLPPDQAERLAAALAPIAEGLPSR